MSFYQNGILISGVNTLPELTRAQYEALPADKHPEYWVCLDEEYEPSSSGHVIENNDGTDMPQEENLQFVGVYTEDDPTNDRTKVNIVREMTSAQMEALTPAQKKGFIRTTDEPDNPISDLVSRETIRTGVVLERYGKYRRLAMRNVSPTSSNGLMATLSEEDRPHQFSTNIVLGVSQSNALYTCYTTVNPTTGNIQAYYFTSGATTDSPAPTTMKIYGDIDWLVD